MSFLSKKMKKNGTNQNLSNEITVKIYLYVTNKLFPGASMRISGDRGATTCHANTDGVFSNGLWVVPTISTGPEPAKPVKPILYFSRVALARKHGYQAQTN